MVERVSIGFPPGKRFQAPEASRYTRAAWGPDPSPQRGEGPRAVSAPLTSSGLPRGRRPLCRWCGQLAGPCLVCPGCEDLEELLAEAHEMGL